MLNFSRECLKFALQEVISLLIAQLKERARTLVQIPDQRHFN